MPSGIQAAALTAQEAANAIFLDFEGTKTDRPSLLGWYVEGRWTATVLEPVFEPMVPHGHPLGTVHFRPLADILIELREMSVLESRAVVCWSERERTAICEDETLDSGLRDWWEDNLVNILKPAKRWARENGVEVPAIRNSYGKESSASLTGFRHATGYEPVARNLEHGNTAKRIRAVRRQIELRGTFEALTPTVKGHWTKVLSHNFHDCAGLAHVCNVIFSTKQT